MLKWLNSFVAVAGIVVFSACGSVSNKDDDAGNSNPPDARVNDAGVNPTIDAAPSQPPSTTQEITAGSGKASGSMYEIEVQIGHSVSQEPTSGATYEVEGAAAVKP